MNTEADVGWKLNYIEKVLSSERPALSTGKNEWVAAIARTTLSSPATTGVWGEVNLGQGLTPSIAVEDALAELRLTIEILSVRSLCTDQALVTYLRTLNTSVVAYEKAEAEGQVFSNRVSRLSIALAIARGVLRDEVATLSAWSAIQRCIYPEATSFPIPSRFLKKLDGFVSMPPATDAEVRSLVDLATLP